MAVRVSLLIGFCCVFAAGAGETAPEQPKPNPALAAPDTARFKADVAPFLAAHCTKCHGEKKKEAKLALHTLTADLAAGKNLAVWQAVADRLKAGEMPPEGEKQPAPATIKVVTDWIDGELAKAGKAGAVAAGSLRTGNHVPHHLLFGDKIDFPLDNPPRLWRISPSIYTESVKEAGKGLKIAQPFSLPAGEGFKDVAAGFGLDESTTAQLIRNAEAIVGERLGLSRPGAKATVKEFAPLLDDKTPPAQVVEAAVRKQYDLVLRRPPTAGEVKALVELYSANVKTAGPVVGTRLTLMAVHLTPEAVFRYEFGGGGADAAGRRLLAPRELAFAVAYALTDRTPDAELLRAADAGRLATADDVAREARRLLADPKAEKPRLLRFFREYFGYAEAENVFKDQKAFPAHYAKGLVDDTDRLVKHILDKDKDVLRELLTTEISFAHYARTDTQQKQLVDALAKYEEAKKKDPKKNPPNVADKAAYRAYNLPDFVPAAQQPTALPKGQRSGVLTQPSWLTAHSANFDNHAIRRGKWVRERLLGLTVPDLPITVDAQLPDEPHKTLRERMEVTRKEYCWQCHQKMNPLGLTFEIYDHFGRFRTTETVEDPAPKKDAKGKPLPTSKEVAFDSTGRIEGTGDPKLDGPVKDAVELLHKLAGSDRVRQVFVRHAFRYFVGRDENLGDARSLRAADQAFVESGGSFKALVVAILTSESFLYRTESK